MGCGGTKVANTVQADAHQPNKQQQQEHQQLQLQLSPRKASAASNRSDSGVSCVDQTPPPSHRDSVQQEQEQQNNDGAELDQGLPEEEEEVLQIAAPTPVAPGDQDIAPQETTTTTSDENTHKPQVTETTDMNEKKMQSEVKTSQQWEKVKADVAQLINELNNTKTEDQTAEEAQYLTFLTQWQEKYGSLTLPEDPSRSGGSVDEVAVPLNVDAESVRSWVSDWEPFDLTPIEVQPPQTMEVEIELGDPDDTFSATLRTYLTEYVAFDFDIEGEAAWSVLPQSVIAEDIMTPEQTLIHRTREERTDLHDPERMRRRREKLAEHFIEVRELPASVVLPFLQWADLLEQNRQELEKLCMS